MILGAPSVGERLRASASGTPKGPRPRAALAGVQLMRRSVAREQNPVIASIEALGATVLRSTQSVLSAVFVRATEEQAAAIAGLPGVRSIVGCQRYEPMLSTASDIVQVSPARIRPAGAELYGDGIKIGIIDAGLDFEHEAFRDDSLPPMAGYPRGDPEYIDLASSKVIAVRSYVELLNRGSPAASTPDDNSPWDSSGHGTGVTMIAAGKRVDSPVGPVSGIAPRARIGVYKVFGTPGLNFYTADHAVIAALDDAVNDGMDIVNLSLGNPMFYPWDAHGRDCGISFPNAACNPLSVAVQSLVEDMGIVVVAAAGNYGWLGTPTEPGKSTIIVPGNAPSAITVGGTGNSASVVHAVHVGGQSFEARSGTGPDADGPLTAPAVLASDLFNPRACSPFPAGSLTEKLVVIDRGACFFLHKVEHADAAGAVGALVINHVGEALIGMALLEDTDIPAFFVGNSDGEAIRELLADQEEGLGNELTLDPTPVVSEKEWAFVNPRSSRGPTLALDPKPDLVAPSIDVYTAAPRYNTQGTLYTPSGFRSYSGTSFAAPFVAGAAALVWQGHPDLTAGQVASALINSASPIMSEDGERERLTAAGAGVLDIGAAVRSSATVVPPSVSFGSVRGASYPIRRRIEIANKTVQRQTYLLSVEPRDADVNGRVTINERTGASFTLAPGGSIGLEVALQGSQPAPGAYEGFLRLTSLNAKGPVSVPYYYVAGDNEPYDALVLRGRDETGIEGEESTETVAARVLDRFGVPVAGRSVRFAPGQSSVNILRTTPSTTPHGLLYASVRYGPDPGEQTVVAVVGELKVGFKYDASGVKPAVSSIANSASLATSGLAPGSLATIGGTNFSIHSSGPPPEPQVRRLPLMRKGVSVAFDAPGFGISVAGRIASVTLGDTPQSGGDDSLLVQVPWELAGADRAYVKVRAENTSEPVGFPLSTTAPGIFHSSDGTDAYAAAMRFDGSTVSVSNPAVRGETVTIAMTGNGPVHGRPETGAAGSLLNTTLHAPTVWIAGQRALVTYSGLDPGLAGLYLLTVVVPEDLPAGSHPLSVEITGAKSNEVILPVR